MAIAPAIGLITCQLVYRMKPLEPRAPTTWLACISTTGRIDFFALEPLAFRTSLACGLRRSRIPSSPGASGPAPLTDGGADDETDRR
jgi:hypothetical protein